MITRGTCGAQSPVFGTPYFRRIVFRNFVDIDSIIYSNFNPVFITTSIGDEENDGFDPLLQQDGPEDLCWLSEEQAEELRERPPGGCPDASEWKEGNSELGNIAATADKARRFLWKAAKAEAGVAREAWDESHPPSGALASAIFGPGSKLLHQIGRAHV